MRDDQSSEYDFVIYIGRFQPLHLGHNYMLDKALALAWFVIVFIGSANLPRDMKNPWSFEERAQMIRDAYPDIDPARLIILPLNDHTYNNDGWLGQVQNKVNGAVVDNGYDPETARVAVIGFEKDSTTYYLKQFPQWDEINIEDSWGTVSATQIRNNFFQRAPILPHDLCSMSVIEYMRGFMLSVEFRNLLDEAEELKRIHTSWAGSPFTPMFIATDAVVTQSGHILLVTRDIHPGMGLLALPGGHVKPEIGDSFDNCVKELWEEARPQDGIAQRNRRGKALPKGRLRGFYTGKEMRFDAPGRDPRGFYLTTAFRFVFPDGDLWPVRGGLPIDGEPNDVSHAAWYPIGSLDPRLMFADHYFIIQAMLGKSGEKR